MKQHHVEIFSLLEELKDGKINPDDVLIDRINKFSKENYSRENSNTNTLKKEDLIPIALALRYGADPNMYLQLNEVGNIHLLGYVYYNLSRPLISCKYKDVVSSLEDENKQNILLNSIVLMLKLSGADPSMPAFMDDCSLSSFSSSFSKASTQIKNENKEKVTCAALLTKDYSAIKCVKKSKDKEKILYTEKQSITQQKNSSKKSIFSWVCESGYSNILMEKEDNVKPETLSLMKAYLDQLIFSSNKMLENTKDIIYAHSQKSLLSIIDNFGDKKEFTDSVDKYLSYSIESFNYPAFTSFIDEGYELKYYHVTYIISLLSSISSSSSSFSSSSSSSSPEYNKELKIRETSSLLEYITPLALLDLQEEEKEEEKENKEEKGKGDITFESLKYQEIEEIEKKITKTKGETKQEKVLREMLLYAIERGTEMDLYQLDMLEKYDRQFSEYIKQKYEIPYWRKFCKGENKRGILTQKIKHLAYNLNLNFVQENNNQKRKQNLCEHIAKLAQANVCELKKGYIRRQEQRIASTLNSPLAFISECNPKAVLRNKSLIENLYEHVDNDIVFYKDSKDIGWAFTRDQFPEILEKKLNPYTQERLPVLLTDEMEKRLAFYDSIFDFYFKNGGDKGDKIYTISETLELLHSDDEISNKKTDLIVYNYNKENKVDLTLEDMNSSFKSSGIEFDLLSFYKQFKDETYTKIVYILSSSN